MLCLSPNRSAATLPPKTIELSAVASPKVPYTFALFTPFAISLLFPTTMLFLDNPFTVLFSPII